MEKQRIAYIDAMRGFTMILVVFSHICSMCLGDRWMGWNDIFFLLNIFSSWLVRKRAAKRQDWLLFTFALIVSVSAFCYDVYYNRYFSHLGWLTKGLGFASLITWRYYLFFYIGTIVKRHFKTFIRWTDKPIVIIPVILGFIVISQIPHTDCIPLVYLVFAVGGILGLTMIFTFFRHIGSFLSSHSTFHFSLLTFNSLENICTHTLDIYLLHYFFLPRFLLTYNNQLRAYDSKLLEFFVALMLALIVVALCLVVSRIIRLSPFLAKYLFGVPQRK